MKSAYALLKIF